MKTPLFTVAILCCETAPFLERAIDSVASQDFEDFDALLIAEESRDNSLEIARRRAESDARFKCAELPRSGSGAASRNYAISRADGQYVVFLDGDDWLKPDALRRFAASIYAANRPDVLMINAEEVEENGGKFELRRIVKNLPESFDGAETDGESLILNIGKFGAAVNAFSWLSVCRTDFLRTNELYQNAGLFMEDFEWSPRCWLAAKRIKILSKPLYVYRRRANSATTQASAKILFDISAQFSSFIGYLKGREIRKSVRAVLAKQWFSLLFWYSFEPVYDSKFSDSDRLAARNMLLSPENAQFLSDFARMLPPFKRILFALYRIDGRIGILLAKTLYRAAFGVSRRLSKTRNGGAK